jgi:hypothetical protein
VAHTSCPFGFSRFEANSAFIVAFSVLQRTIGDCRSGSFDYYNQRCLTGRLDFPQLGAFLTLDLERAAVVVFAMWCNLS